MSKIFVAGPFNHPDDFIKKLRTDSIATYCVKLFNEGHVPVSALLCGLTFAEHGNLPTDTNTWENFSKVMVKGCDELHVLQLEGWDLSSGVKLEIEEAKNLNIPIIYITL